MGSCSRFASRHIVCCNGRRVLSKTVRLFGYGMKRIVVNSNRVSAGASLMKLCRASFDLRAAGEIRTWMFATNGAVASVVTVIGIAVPRMTGKSQWFCTRNAMRQLTSRDPPIGLIGVDEDGGRKD